MCSISQAMGKAKTALTYILNVFVCVCPGLWRSCVLQMQGRSVIVSWTLSGWGERILSKRCLNWATLDPLRLNWGENTGESTEKMLLFLCHLTLFPNKSVFFKVQKHFNPRENMVRHGDHCPCLWPVITAANEQMIIFMTLHEYVWIIAANESGRQVFSQSNLQSVVVSVSYRGR